MSEKIIKTKIKQTIDTVENWNSSSYIPLDGELVIYKYSNGNRLKIGDGQAKVTDLPFVDNPLTISVTPVNIQELIKAAPPGSTIALTDGDYDVLALTGDAGNGKVLATRVEVSEENNESETFTYKYKGTKFPDNLTIVGCKDARINGVSISSGVDAFKEIRFNGDIRNATLSSNLSFKNVTFLSDVSLRNSEIDGLSFDNCEFLNGACLTIAPNKIADVYGDDTSKTMAQAQYYATRKAHNITVSNCKFSNTSDTTADTVIYLDGIDGAVISNSTIETLTEYGIKVTGITNNLFNSLSTGRIAITNNTISNVNTRFIAMDYLDDANVIVMYNKCTGPEYNESTTTFKCIDISGYNSNSSIVTTINKSTSETNKYNGVSLNSYPKLITFTPSLTTVETTLQKHDNKIQTNANVIQSTKESLNSHLKDTNNPHKMTAKQLGIEDVNNLQLKKVVCEATPDTLADVIANAQPNTTINLIAGEYDLLTLNSNTSYPENLMIVGHTTKTAEGTAKDSIMAGVSITSGVKAGDINTNSDISKAIMPENITFKNITFSDSFCVRNCDITDLTIYGCEFLEGTHLNITPNSMSDMHGNDGSATMSQAYYYATRRAHNVTVQNCIFINANVKSSTTAIYLNCVDGATIQGNIIYASAHNAIQIAGTTSNQKFHAPSIGRIAITSNMIYAFNTEKAGINVHHLKNADVILAYNGFTFDPSNEKMPCYISVSYYDTTSIVSTKIYEPKIKDLAETNYYKVDLSNAEEDKTKISIDNDGIIFEQSPTSIEESILDVTNSINDLKSYEITVSDSDDLLDIIKNAKTGTIITLSAGNYPQLDLLGKDTFKDNITLKGVEGTIIDGVSISSGQCPYYDVQTEKNCDISEATMSSNITFSNITFSKSFCVRNSEIDGVRVLNCTFEKGAMVQICPNSFKDALGGDDNPSSNTTLDAAPYYATRVAHNVVVKDCTFIDANTKTDGTYDNRTAIYLKGVNGAAINNNTILGAGHNGIQIDSGIVAYKSEAVNTGKIAITNNNISGTGSRAMRLNGIENATLYLLYNDASDTDKKEYNDGEIIKITCDPTTEVITNYKSHTKDPLVETNTFNGIPLVAGSSKGSPLLISTSSTSGDFATNVLLTRITELEGFSSSLNKVENKSSEDIRNELTSENVINALNQDIEQFRGPQGVSGVYLGSGEMPEGCNVQIDPNGTPITYSDLISSIVASLPVYNGEVL